MVAGKEAKVMIVTTRSVERTIGTGLRQVRLLSRLLGLPARLAHLFDLRPPSIDVADYEPGNERFLKDNRSGLSAAEATRQRNIDVQSVSLLLPPFG
jgi:hypothetical protein